MKRVVCENIRSAYNVGNIIRTADALWRWVVILGYTAGFDHKKVTKTALGAEKEIPIKSIDNISNLFIMTEEEDAFVICAEKTENSISLQDLGQNIYNLKKDIYVIVWNEVTGVETESLQKCDIVCEIPMQWAKESLNVWQATAIFMREINKFIK